MNPRRAILSAALVLAGCTSGPQADGGLSDTSAGASASAASSGNSSGAGSSSGGVAAGLSAGSSGTATVTGIATASGSGPSGGLSTGSASSGTGSGTGSGPGGSTTGVPAPIDGGYAFCSVADSPYGGPNHDGGAASWMCPSGTYVCDLSGAPGSCFQCADDRDCANAGLPTYDPRRPHCDLFSGVAGYQGFCQECTTSDDCAANADGLFCDLNPAFVMPGLEPRGFESCGTLETDCRRDGGTFCGPDADCSADSGACIPRSLSCTSDDDCKGLVSTYDLEPLAFCVGGTCRTCEARDGGNCGCDDNQTCGDAGLICIAPGTAGSYCAVACNSADAPLCPFYSQICEPDSGLCQECSSDDQCLSANVAQGSVCYLGRCSCNSDAGCPAGESCELTAFGDPGQCGPPVLGCTPASCPGDFCDWDAGACTKALSCLTDYDCSTSFLDTPICKGGTCVQCQSDADCRYIPTAADGLTPYPLCCLAGDNSYCDEHHYANFCVPACHENADCTFSTSGPTCFVTSDAGHGTCTSDRCTTGAECGASTKGSVCLTDGGTTNGYGYCGCNASSDCPLGAVCDTAGTPVPMCTGCSTDADCAPGELCDPAGACRSHCDGTNQCDATRKQCDLGNAQGQNGQTKEGASAGTVWCYSCATSADCSNGAGCSAASGGVCEACATGAACASGNCLNGVCLAACNGGACPGGQLCEPDAGFCYQCLGPIDCPNGEGCNSVTHTCGTCTGPDFYGIAPDDCPPGDFCSLYWLGYSPSGVCLQPCDDRSCDAEHPICAKLPALTTEHAYCFGCLSDSDCVDAGGRCDTSERLTFMCGP